MTEKVGNRNVRLIVLLLWVLLAFFYTSVAYDYIVASNQDKKLEEYLQYIVVFCGDTHRPTKEVLSLVMIKANELQLNLRTNDVGITGFGPTLKIGVNYEVDIQLPVLHRTIYHKFFNHLAVYRNIR